MKPFEKWNWKIIKDNMVEYLSWKNKSNIVMAILVFLLMVCIGLFIISVEKLQFINETMDCIDDISTNLQRLVRMEITEEPNDTILETIDELLVELEEREIIIHSYTGMSGSGICFRYLANTSSNWEELKEEIYKVREKGWESTRIVWIAETMYYNTNTVSDEMEKHFDTCTEQLKNIQYIICGIICVIIVLWITRIVQYIKMVKHRDELFEIAYIDTLTNTKNRSACDRLLKNKKILEKDSVVMIFDLNDLKILNDTLGHLYGNMLIKDFADILNEIAEHLTNEENPIFVGRFGGDEFLVHFVGEEDVRVQRYLEEVERLTKEMNHHNRKYQISYAVGYAKANDYKEIVSLAGLLEMADMRMYENKAQVKQSRK